MPQAGILKFAKEGRDVTGDGEGYQLREEPGHYKALFGAEKDDIGLQNTYLWEANGG